RAHDNGQNTLELTFNYTATDSDGDTASNNFTVDVKDDVPQVTGGISTHAVGEDGLPGANLTGAASTRSTICRPARSRSTSTGARTTRSARPRIRPGGR